MTCRVRRLSEIKRKGLVVPKPYFYIFNSKIKLVDKLVATFAELTSDSAIIIALYCNIYYVY